MPAEQLGTRAGYTTATIPIALVLHNDVVRSHATNRCPTCHPPECWVCAQATLIGVE